MATTAKATLAKVTIYFFIYSIIGWIWETIYCSTEAGHFVYRGFLHGPYCPIYGFGILLVLYFVLPLRETTLELFLFSAITVTILEYATSVLLERFFGVSLWNYNDVPLNIHGRVAIPVSIFWGFCCVVIVKYIHPHVEVMVNWLYNHCGLWLPGIIIILMLTDTVISIHKMSSFQKRITDTAQSIGVTQETTQDKKESPLERLRLDTANGLSRLRNFDMHILKTFPRLQIRDIKNFDELRELILEKKQNKK